MRLATVAAMAMAAVMPALAKSDSAYTKIMTPDAKCKVVDSNEEEGWAVTKCPGYKGIPVWIGEGDLRAMVGYGENGSDEMAYQRTFGPFNTTGETVEWRLRNGKPVATILRWIIDGGPDMPKGEMLVVTQLEAGNQCWIAVVAAHKNKKANELARQAADELAGTVDCTTTEPEIVGTPDHDIFTTE